MRVEEVGQGQLRERLADGRGRDNGERVGGRGGHRYFSREESGFVDGGWG